MTQMLQFFVGPGKLGRPCDVTWLPQDHTTESIVEETLRMDAYQTCCVI